MFNAVGRRLGLLCDTLITEEAHFVIPLGRETRVSYRDLAVEDTVFHLSRVSQPIYPKSNYGISEAPRGISKHCPVLLCFLFKSVVGTHFQLLLQVCTYLVLSLNS